MMVATYTEFRRKKVCTRAGARRQHEGGRRRRRTAAAAVAAAGLQQCVDRASGRGPGRPLSAEAPGAGRAPRRGSARSPSHVVDGVSETHRAAAAACAAAAAWVLSGDCRGGGSGAYKQRGWSQRQMVMYTIAVGSGRSPSTRSMGVQLGAVAKLVAPFCDRCNPPHCHCNAPSAHRNA